jgi:hypothetical protein
MKKNGFFWKGGLSLACALLVAAGCEELDDDVARHTREDAAVPLAEVAQILSKVPLGAAQLAEVAGAVSASATNGYDEEYTMQNLFADPGAGVGDAQTRGVSDGRVTGTPLRDLLAAAVAEHFATRSGTADPEEYIASLSASDIQIYWPYAEEWDGETLPVITYDPLDGGDRNVGWTPEGDKIIIDEEVAQERPVWVINRNEDAQYKSLEMLRREDPGWGSGGEIVVGASHASARTRAAAEMRTLVMRSFKAARNYDCWFAGGAEFFVKCGAVEDFTATTEAELALYNPTVTDFMIVVRRKQVGQALPFNAVLVSEWSSQLDQIALMIVEDDGGTQTTWKCSAVVKYNSKAYGIEVAIPLNSRDDIVWRGQLSRRYIEKYSGKSGRFGDVDLVLELI